ncbi:hypothetical protein ACH4TV_27590 [Streptomyces sp. NPDC020898]|uniref:hypothetical protein n=1 Tax=Streptomyces sp. NPDC020898 TaxID=3365101 RepID=UPI0037A3CBC3
METVAVVFNVVSVIGLLMFLLAWAIDGDAWLSMGGLALMIGGFAVTVMIR